MVQAKTGSFKEIQKQRQESEFPCLVNLQSCVLPVISGAFQTGVVKTRWELDKVRLVKEMV